MKQTVIESKDNNQLVGKVSILDLEEQKKHKSIQERDNKNEENRKNLMKMCERDREKVKGIFRFYECEGGTLSFPFKAYKWDEIQSYTLVDGEIYSIPLGVAKHLNKNGWYPVHQNMVDANGAPVARIGSKKRRFGFQSLEFIDPTEIGESKASEIVTVSSF